MKQLFLFLSMVLFSFVSCKKDSSKNASPSSSSSTGTIQFVNNSSNPYSMYINGSPKGTLPGKNTTTFTVDYGSYSCRVVQNSGYVLYPTDKTYTGTVSSSGGMVVSFP